MLIDIQSFVKISGMIFKLYSRHIFCDEQLLFIDIYMKFLEDIMNRFQVTERTRFCDGQSSKGNSSKSINARVMVLALCTLSTVD